MKKYKIIKETDYQELQNELTRFEPSEHAKLLSQLDKHNEQNVEYWSKRND